MGILIGIVGKPSSGKSTFLNASCLASAKTGDYPFTTVEPNRGSAFVTAECVCKEFEVEDNPKNSLCMDGTRLIKVDLLDVAGLVPGAHEGRGLGNKFLTDLSSADVLLHIVDISGSLDAEGNKVDGGSHDPHEDIEFLQEEISLWIVDILTRKNWEKFSSGVTRQKVNIPDALEERLSGLKINRIQIHRALVDASLEGIPLTSWTNENLVSFARKLQKIAKPIVVVANKIDLEPSHKLYDELREKYDLIPASALAEFYLRSFSEEGLIKYTPGASSFVIPEGSSVDTNKKKALQQIQEKILDIYGSTGIQRAINHAVFDILGLITVYPVSDPVKLTDKDGLVLPDVFLVERDTHIKQFVEKCIHSDLAEGFLYGIDARTKKRLGENYLVQDRDVIKIVSTKGR